jgi:hypothetical protein
MKKLTKKFWEKQVSNLKGTVEKLTVPYYSSEKSIPGLEKIEQYAWGLFFLVKNGDPKFEDERSILLIDLKKLHREMHIIYGYANFKGAPDEECNFKFIELFDNFLDDTLWIIWKHYGVKNLIFKDAELKNTFEQIAKEKGSDIYCAYVLINLPEKDD